MRHSRGPHLDHTAVCVSRKIHAEMKPIDFIQHLIRELIYMKHEYTRYRDRSRPTLDTCIRCDRLRQVLSAILENQHLRQCFCPTHRYMFYEKLRIEI